MAKHIVIETTIDHQTPLGALFAERAIIEVIGGNRLGGPLSGWDQRLNEIENAFLGTRAETSGDLKLKIASLMLEIEKDEEFCGSRALRLLSSLADDLDHMEIYRNESSSTAPASSKAGLHRRRSN